MLVSAGGNHRHQDELLGDEDDERTPEEEERSSLDDEGFEGMTRSSFGLWWKAVKIDFVNPPLQSANLALWGPVVACCPSARLRLLHAQSCLDICLASCRRLAVG